MTFENARTSYRRAETNKQIEIEDPHEMIGVTLRELERALRILANAQEGKLPLPANYLNRAFTAIYILQSSLDFERGGEIATNLFQVYEFCRLQVVDAFARKPEAKLAASADHIASLMAAWQQMSVRVKQT